MNQREYNIFWDHLVYYFSKLGKLAHIINAFHLFDVFFKFFL